MHTHVFGPNTEETHTQGEQKQKINFFSLTPSTNPETENAQSYQIILIPNTKRQAPSTDPDTENFDRNSKKTKTKEKRQTKTLQTAEIE